MSESNFRTAMLGGFNRQDVMSYITTTNQVNRERIAQLEQTAKLAKDTANKAEAQLEAATASMADLEQRATKLDAVETELAVKSTKLEQTLSALTTAQARLAQLEQGAAAYADLKDRMATIELEAHQRAQHIEAAAQERADELERNTDALLEKVEVNYKRLLADVDATINHAMTELTRSDQAMAGLKTEFASYEAQVQALVEDYKKDKQSNG